MEYCALRKLGRDVFPYQDPEGRYKEILKLLKDAEGDPAELERYKSLQGYPAGSLGRAFFDFYAQFDRPLPGDPLWISEDLTVRHGLVHVLCSYDISVNGEFCVSAFTAGNSECFNWMIAMLGFTPPYVSTGAQFHPDDFTHAYARGERASRSSSTRGNSGRSSSIRSSTLDAITRSSSRLNLDREFAVANHQATLIQNSATSG